MPDRVSSSDTSSESSRTSDEMLCQFALHMTQIDLHRDPGSQMVSHLQSVFPVECAAIYDADRNNVSYMGNCPADLDDLLRNTYIFESVVDEPRIGLTRRVLRIGNLPIGAMMLRGEVSPLTSSFIAYLVAITLDRFHSLAHVSKTEGARRAEQLRTTVLDSLAHAYKTPLTVIRAASTGLHEMSALTESQSELMQLIDQQTSLLSDLTTHLLKTAQIEARDLILHSEATVVAPVIENVVASFCEKAAGLSLNVVMQSEELVLSCDRNLLAMLLTQYIDNAIKYADTGSIVTIQAAERPKDVVFSVHSIGPVIPEADHQQIFDRYFRCADSAHAVPGTGIGLSIAKHAAQAHGGDVWLASDLVNGTTFFASLPI